MMKRRTALPLLIAAALLGGEIWLAAQFQGKAASPKSEPLPPDPQALTLQSSFARVAEHVKPAVVSVMASHLESVPAQPYQFFFGDPFEEFFQDFGEERPSARGRDRQSRPEQRRLEGLGSGVVVDARGYILTNEYVVHDADKIEVRVFDPEEKIYPGKVVGTDPRSDLAVVKISPKGALTAAVLGDSDKVKVGDWAVAIGSPFGLEQTVTVGVISAVRQSLNIEGKPYQNLLQTDAAINRGNSGGPLANIRGEVIGINTAIYAPTGVFNGIGFAIPSSRAKEIMLELIDKGRVVRGWMGVEITPLNDVLAREFGVADKNGVILNRVMPGSPADKAGLKRGDVVREFEGSRVTNSESLQQAVAKTKPHRTVRLKIIRDRKEMEVSLVTGEMPGETPEEKAESPGKERTEPAKTGRWEGARVGGLTAAARERYGLPKDLEGVVVTGVEPGGAAEPLGLAEGDVIGSLNRNKTPDVESFEKAAAKIDLAQGVVLDVYRDGRWLYLSYRSGD